MLHSIDGGKNPHPCPLPVVQTAKPCADDLTDVIAGTRNMASILATLLEERIVSTGKGPLTVGRRDADDLQFAARQLMLLIDQAAEIWEALP